MEIDLSCSGYRTKVQLCRIKDSIKRDKQYHTPAELIPESVDFLKTESKGLVPYTLDLDYNYWTAGTSIGLIDSS